MTRVTMDDPESMAAAVAKVQEREKDLQWTDPDNPEAGLQDIREVMAEGGGHGPWMVSFTDGKKAGMRQQKPLVVWFTNSKSSPICRVLSAEVFSTPQFTSWASQEVVRVRLDFNVRGRNEDDKIRKRQYLEGLKKRYKVLGIPTVVVMAPDGAVIETYRGFKRSYGKFYFDRLKRAAEAADKHHQEWVVKKKRRGYRIWTDSKGRTLFAKLLRYRDGQMILAEPDGHKIRARESHLSAVDRQWIQREMAKRRG